MMYGSPVVYPASLIPDQYRLVYALNPMVGVIEGFRSAVLGTNPMPWDMIGVGFTLGYHLNENIQLTAGYMASVNDSGPTDLHMDVVKLSLVFGWHPLVEGMKRLGGE